MNVPFLKFSTAEQLSGSGEESDLNSTFSTRAQSICSRQAARKVFFLLSHILSGSHPCAVDLRRDCSCLQAHDSDLRASLREFFLPHQSSALHPLTQSGLVEEGGRAFCLGTLGPNGNLCCLQQSNPEAGGILNRAERASPVLLGTPSPPASTHLSR